ncbi:MAG: MarR family winged helix-turn-helix transcriptional regulator [Actinomadura sp.]
MSETRWLDAAQQRDWRAFIEGSVRLLDLLDRDLKARHSLTISEYEILVRLSEAPERRLRMAELASSASQSRSRLSHTCGRLEAKGLVRRDSCPGDKRGVFAVLTEQGFDILECAARDHVTAVREFFVDAIEPGDLEALGRAFRTVTAHIADIQ